jgi:hypothetical protein
MLHEMNEFMLPELLTEEEFFSAAARRKGF